MSEPPAARGWRVLGGPGGTVVELTGDWIARDGGGAGPDAVAEILGAAGTDLKAPAGISFDATGLGHWDSALLLFVTALRRAARDSKVPVDESGLPQAALRLLAMTMDTSPPAPDPGQVSLVRRAGQTAIAVSREALSVMTMIGDTVLRGGAAMTGRARMRGTDLLRSTYEAGASALPIVTVVNVLVGGILAFVGSVQLRRFGADIYIANLVGVAMVREMAALMTAIVMAGRTGGAYAAHVATMQGSEEIDALRVIGIPVYDYLVMPRVLALTGMMPLLYLYGSAVGILGGFVVAVAMLNLSPNAFIDQTIASIAGIEIVFGLVKSIAFGVLIAIAGCRCGINAGRSAADVGRAATSAVVVGIVGVIALDAVFAVCANALDF